MSTFNKIKFLALCEDYIPGPSNIHNCCATTLAKYENNIAAKSFNTDADENDVL